MLPASLMPLFFTLYKHCVHFNIFFFSLDPPMFSILQFSNLSPLLLFYYLIIIVSMALTLIWQNISCQAWSSSSSCYPSPENRQWTVFLLQHSQQQFCWLWVCTSIGADESRQGKGVCPRYPEPKREIVWFSSSKLITSSWPSWFETLPPPAR